MIGSLKSRTALSELPGRIRDTLRNAYRRLTENTGLSAFFLFFLTFSFTALLTWFLPYPYLSDEYVTMGEGISLLVKDFNVDLSVGGMQMMQSYYGYATPLLYGWVYGLTHDIITVYRVALLLNAVFAGGMAVLAYRIAGRLKLTPDRAFIISLVTGLYPAYITQSMHAWDETALYFVNWLILYLLVLYGSQTETGKQVLTAVLLAVSSMLAYMIHGRGIALLIASGAVFLVMTVRKRDKRKGALCLAAFLLPIVCMYFANAAVRQYIIKDVFKYGNSVVRNTGTQIATYNAMDFSFTAMVAYVRTILGQLYYSVCATFGCISFCFVETVREFRRSRREKDKTELNTSRIIITYMFLMSVLTVIIVTAFFSTTMVSASAKRLEYYFYGRYAEIFCGMSVFFCLARMAGPEESGKTAAAGKVRKAGREEAWGIGISLLVLAAGFVINGRTATDRHMLQNCCQIQAIASFSLLDNHTYMSLRRLALFTLLIMFMIVILRRILRKRPGLAYMILCCLFIYSSLYAAVRWEYPASEASYDRVSNFRSFIYKADGAGIDIGQIYALDYGQPKYDAPFSIPNHSIRFLETETIGYEGLSGLQDGSIIISGDDRGLDKLFSNCYAVNIRGEIMMWAVGDSLAEELRSAGWKCYQREDTIETYNGDSLKLEGSRVTGNLKACLLAPGSTQTGPYDRLYPGTYKVTVRGKNLDVLSYSAGYFGGRIPLTISDLSVSDTTAEYTLHVPFICSDVNMDAQNNSQEYAEVESLTTEKTGGTQRIPLSEAGTLEIAVNRYRVSNYSSLFYDNLSGDNVLIGQMNAVIGAGSTLTETGLRLCKGNSTILVYVNDPDHTEVNVEGHAAIQKRTTDSAVEIDVSCSESCNADVTIRNSGSSALWFGELDVVRKE